MRYSGAANSFSVILAAIISIGIAQDRLSAAPCPCDIYAAGRNAMRRGAQYGAGPL